MSTLNRRTLPSVLTTLRNLVQQAAPAGVIEMYGGAAAPGGWLLCDGSSVLRTDYPDLFTAIGTAYGSVDGTHFTLPNFGSKFARGNTPGTGGGADTHTHTAAAHSHALSDNGQAQVTRSTTTIGARIISTPSYTDNAQVVGSSSTGGGTARTFGAALAGSTDSATPGNTGSSSNVPAYTGVTFIIKT